MQQAYPENAGQPMDLAEPEQPEGPVESAKPSSEEERGLMREAMQHRLKDGETWYIVARNWFLKWKAYVNYDIAYTYYTATRPGRIPNEDLLESADGKQKLKKFLQEGVDFELVPEKAWQLLEGWYGGEPIPRFVIKTGSSLSVEMYELSLTLVAAGKGLIPKSVPVSLSKTTAVSHVQQLAKRLLEIPEDEQIVMWDALNPTTKFRKLDEEWATLKESSVYDGDTIIVELASSVAAAENDYAYSSYSKSVIASTPGVCGLGNLGNTCFMNSSLQCLSHTVPLRNYFISGQFLSEINALNLLGTKGELAQAFGALLRDMWSGNHSSVSPRHFKTVLGRHAEQFMGYDQHDSQELIAYLLDGIHEDVNRIEKKPYVEQVEAKDGEPDEGAADRAWDGHLRRNNSKIVELFQGQFKSVVTCPHEGCNRVSVTFDPFMYLSVPLVNDEKSFVVTYIPANGATPRRFNVTVSKTALLKTLGKTALKKFRQLSDIPDTDDSPDLLVCDINARTNEVWQVLDLKKCLADLIDNVNLYLYEVSPKVADFQVPPAPDLSWTQRFKAYVYKETYFTNSLSGSSPELYTIERYLSSAEDLLSRLNKCRTDDDVARTTDSSYDFSFMRSLDEVGNFAQCVRDGVDWLNWFKNSFDEEHLVIMSAQELERRVKDYYGSYITKISVEYTLFPIVLRYTHGYTTLGHILEQLARLSHRFIRRPIDERPADETGEDKIQFALSILKQCEPFAEVKRKYYNSYDQLPITLTSGQDYSSPESGFNEKDHKAEDERTPTQEQIFDVPLSRWLTKGSRLQLRWSARLSEMYLDAQEAESVTLEAESKNAESKALNLFDCIDCFVRKEQLEETEMWYCSNCKEHRQAWKQFFLWRAAPVLVIHLKRFQYSGLHRDKLDHLVTFPLEGLDLTRYVLDQRLAAPAIYDLVAVSNHYGGLGGGHYTAYAKDSDTGKWYNYDDSYVSEVSPHSVVTSAAYVLFYIRRDPSVSSPPVPQSIDDEQPAHQHVEQETKIANDWVAVQTDGTETESLPNSPSSEQNTSSSQPTLADLMARGEQAFEEYNKKRKCADVDDLDRPTYERNMNSGTAQHAIVQSSSDHLAVSQNPLAAASIRSRNKTDDTN